MSYIVILAEDVDRDGAGMAEVVAVVEAGDPSPDLEAVRRIIQAGDPRKEIRTIEVDRLEPWRGPWLPVTTDEGKIPEAVW